MPKLNEWIRILEGLKLFYLVVYPMNKAYIGWFDGLSEKPSHDPGFKARCMVSGKPLVKGKVYTISLMPTKGSYRSYFFRVLKDEWDKLSKKEKSNYESSVIDFTS